MYYGIVALSSIVLLGIDLFTKYLFYDKQILSEIFHPVMNYGISWSIPVHYALIYGIAFGMIVILTRLLVRKEISWRVFSFFLAGTLGNIIDRIFLGGVRDFILVFDWFPVFNIADVFLNVAVILRIFQEFFCKKKD